MRTLLWWLCYATFALALLFVAHRHARADELDKLDSLVKTRMRMTHVYSSEAQLKELAEANMYLEITKQVRAGKIPMDLLRQLIDKGR